MTVEVQTPSGPKSGSAVQEHVVWRQRLIPLPGAGGSDWGGGQQTFGEAPFVDLGNGAVLFATLRDVRYSYDREINTIAFRALHIDELRRKRPNAGDASILDDLARAKPLNVLDRKYYPVLATFTEMANPKSLVEVSPDNLAARFGQGTTLSKITFQVVDPSTPLTTAVTARFPALAAERGLLTLPPS
ncbi:hypothetical protein [Bradyrhizobium liaoningense]|uniref:hypothetical protein n=1 Tax=Bradyrhizobium liaoningense TaxID=43992 RepID=UPI001BAC470F|nr:hypothetical protein [Bradyrhizobium liaoningense]MBR0712957.1 hypothetical protein [Bradyrhizobium liaoningense]